MGKLKKPDPALLKIMLAIYIPGFFIQMGSALTEPFSPLYSRELGAGLPMVGAIAAAQGIGLVIFDLPGGWLGGKIRERTFINISVVLLFFCTLGKGLIQTPLQFLILNIFSGMAMAAWGIGRLAYFRRRIPARIRGRTLAFMGGVMRVTRIITPVIGGFLVKFLGFRMIFFIQAGFTLAAVATSLLMIERGDRPGEEGSLPGNVLKESFRNNGKNIIVAMLGISGLQLLRISRNLIFPLWADHVGASVEMIGSLTSAGGLVETAMVMPAGYVMDRFGRKKAVVPCTIGLGLSLMAFPLARGITGLALVMLLTALSNGIGSGINMTISSDLAPRRAASEFLGLWRFVTDSSQVIGPSLAGVIAGFSTLAYAPLTAGVIGLGAGLILLFGLEETGKPKEHSR